MNNRNIELSEKMFDEEKFSEFFGERISLKDALTIYKKARIATFLLGSENQRKASGTLAQYKKIIVRLKKADPQKQCCFAGFVALDGSADLKDRTKFTYKSALRSYSARIVLKLFPLIMQSCCHQNFKHEIMYFLENFTSSKGRKIEYLSNAQVEELKKSIKFLSEYPIQGLGRFNLQDLPKPANFNRKPSGSKKSDLRYFEDYIRKSSIGSDFYAVCWQHFQSLNPVENGNISKQVAAATFMLTGCRTSEFVRGIIVLQCRDLTRNKPILAFRIAGTKTSTSEAKHDVRTLTQNERNLLGRLSNERSEIDYNNRGQKHRYIIHAHINPITGWYHEILRKYGKQAINIPTAFENELSKLNLKLERITVVPTEHFSGRSDTRKAADNLYKMFVREGQKIFPKAKKNLTPYVFRHGFATYLRNQPETPLKTISSALGHQSDKSQRHYGLSKKSKTSHKFSGVDATASAIVRNKAHAYSQHNIFKHKLI